MSLMTVERWFVGHQAEAEIYECPRGTVSIPSMLDK